MFIAYKTIRFHAATRAMIETANSIINEYQAAGYQLTVRQLYYQFVARDMFPDDRCWRWTKGRWKRDPKGTKNADPNYRWLSTIISDGRLAGLIDWQAIEDRTRNLETLWHFDSPADAVESIARQYHIDMWENQPQRVEVWIEKEALSGVIEKVCDSNDVPYFSCRGYVSQSEQWAAGRRLLNQQHTVILHLGDHDPSGLDMTRDNFDRLTMFSNGSVTVRRIALNWDQIEEYDPPPNPAKSTDSRFETYRQEFGSESWELDALEPSVIETLIQGEIDKIKDPDLWNDREMQLDEDLSILDDIQAGL